MVAETRTPVCFGSGDRAPCLGSRGNITKRFIDPIARSTNALLSYLFKYPIH